jgi:hypothetical protein
MFISFIICVFQSDIIHQSVMELIHSEDREEFKLQLQWNSQLPHEKRDMPLTEILLPGKKYGTFFKICVTLFLQSEIILYRSRPLY